MSPSVLSEERLCQRIGVVLSASTWRTRHAREGCGDGESRIDARHAVVRPVTTPSASMKSSGSAYRPK